MIAIYPRVSTQEQAMHGFSMDEQIERMKKYCEAMGWDAYKVYPDAGFSGASTDRPALQQMIADIKAGKITKVLVYKLDRLSRSQKDTLFLIEDVFLKNNTDFVSMSENFDTSTPFGRAMVGILAVFAQLEREQIKERMAMGKAARARQGKYYASGSDPIGYDYIDGELVINAFEKLQIERIFEEYAAGKSSYTIAEELNKAGMVHKYGEWLAPTVRSLLSKRTYIGDVMYRGEWHKGIHEPIIDIKLFETVQEIRTRKADEWSTQNRRSGCANSYLGGYLECGCCHAKYSKVTDKRKGAKGTYFYEYYKCNSRTGKNKHLVKDPNCKNKTWKMSAFDEAVFAEIQRLKTDPEYYTHIRENRPSEDDRRPILRAEIEKLKNKISNLLELYADDELPKDVVQKRIKELNDQKDNLEQELVDFTAKEAEKMSKTETLEIVDNFSAILANGDYYEIRETIGALIKKIVITGEDIVIHWTFA